MAGGRRTAGVVQIGDTVRRPRSERSDFIARLLRHLEAGRFSGAPRYLGIDDEGRDMFSYVPGHVPPELGELAEGQLTQAARLLRSLHDATLDFDGRGGAEVVCHGDPSPCNCVFLEGVAYAFIDFDDAHPGERLEDLGYAAWLWLDVGNEGISGGVQLERLQRFFGDYGVGGGVDPVGAVMAAQARQISDERLPRSVRQWSEDCLAWTTRHLVA